MDCICTGFIKKGKDLLFGFNLDIDPKIWDFGLYKTKNYFTVGIKVGKTLYFTHGVNKFGHFSNLPYMNDCKHDKFTTDKGKARIDLITDRYIRGKYSFDDVLRITQTKTIVNVPNNSMHSLLSDIDGNALIIEPQYGIKAIKENFAVISNFPLLTQVEKYEPYFGKDRFDIANDILRHSDDNFSPQDGLNLLDEVKQTGQWATRISFVYSKNENSVYYFLDGNAQKIQKHSFK